MKYLSLFYIPDFVIDDNFIRWLHKRRKIDNNFRNKRLGQNRDKNTAVTVARRILELPGTEQKMITEAEKQYEIERLVQTIKGQGKLL